MDTQLNPECPNCRSVNVRFIGDERYNSEIEEESAIIAMWYQCKDCGHKFPDTETQEGEH